MHKIPDELSPRTSLKEDRWSKCLSERTPLNVGEVNRKPRNIARSDSCMEGNKTSVFASNFIIICLRSPLSISSLYLLARSLTIIY